MKGLSIRGLMLGLAAMGMVIPQQSFAAAPQQNVVSSIADVQLVGGQLNGRIINVQGQIVAGTPVSVSRSGQVVASAITNQQGDFSLAGLQTGVYQLSTGNKVVAVRVWDAQIAPPSAKSSVLMVQGDVVRGQCGDDCGPVCCDSGCGGFGGSSLANAAILGVGIAGLTVGIIALDKANDNEDTLANLPASP